jgi:hypothetical protein
VVTLYIYIHTYIYIYIHIDLILAVLQYEISLDHVLWQIYVQITHNYEPVKDEAHYSKVWLLEQYGFV